jgi:hypothetical protein
MFLKRQALFLMTLHRSWLLAVSPMGSMFFTVANSMSAQKVFSNNLLFLKFSGIIRSDNV